MEKTRIFLVIALLDKADGGEEISDIIEVRTEEADAQKIVCQIREGQYLYQEELPLWNRVEYIVRWTNDPEQWSPNEIWSAIKPYNPKKKIAA